jgi:hypothetical protein
MKYCFKCKKVTLTFKEEEAGYKQDRYRIQRGKVVNG